MRLSIWVDVSQEEDFFKMEVIFPNCPDCPNGPRLQIRFMNWTADLSLCYLSRDVCVSVCVSGVNFDVTEHLG